MRKISHIFITVMFMSLSYYARAETEDALLFRGIIQQAHDYSCGTAALATLITGIVENSHVTELDVINNIESLNVKEKGYSAADLIKASIKLGYYAELRKISKINLQKIKYPVILLIGLNSDSPHYVVFKGIEDNEVFIADPIRGNIRIPYSKLIEESINEKYPAWYSIIINPSHNKPISSTLYLSKDKDERHKSHVTVEQSNAITLAKLPKRNQFFINYGFTASLGNNERNGLKISSETFSHVFDIRYGIADNIQIGGSIQYSDDTTDIDFYDNKTSLNNKNRQYSLYANNRFKLDESGKTNLILGLNTLYAEQNDVFGGGFNIIAYHNTEFAQIILGGEIGKNFSHNELADDSLPDYVYSSFIGLNKALGDRYLASVNFSVNDGKSKNNAEEFERSYSASTSLTYVFNKDFQISPSFTYSFGANEVLSFGANVAYVSGW